MLDSYLRRHIESPLRFIGSFLAKKGIPANSITILGFFLGMLSIPAIINENFFLAITLILLNRFFDGIDGTIARHTQATDFGGFLDIVCDFIFYAGVVFAFSLVNINYAPWSAFLIFSFIGPTSSFLAYAILAEKNNRQTARYGKKSFYYLGGICEGTETAFVLALMCLIPQYFIPIALIYGVLCWLTTAGRIYCAWVDFGKSKPLGTTASSSEKLYKAQEVKPKSQAL